MDWNEFRTKNKGKGYSKEELGKLFKAQKKKGKSKAKGGNTFGEDWINFLKKQKGKGLTREELSALYRKKTKKPAKDVGKAKAKKSHPPKKSPPKKSPERKSAAGYAYVFATIKGKNNHTQIFSNRAAASRAWKNETDKALPGDVKSKVISDGDGYVTLFAAAKIQDK